MNSTGCIACTSSRAAVDFDEHFEKTPLLKFGMVAGLSAQAMMRNFSSRNLHLGGAIKSLKVLCDAQMLKFDRNDYVIFDATS